MSINKGGCMNYPQVEPRGLDCSSVQIPVLERLQRQRNELQKRLDDIDAAIESLAANPQVYGVLEALNKLGHY